MFLSISVTLNVEDEIPEAYFKRFWDLNV